MSVRYLWETRRCWICKKYGNCGHREPEIDIAEVRAQLHAELRAMIQAILMEKKEERSNDEDDD